MFKPSELLKEFETTMFAAAFAEHGEYETARQMMDKTGTNRKKVLLGTDDRELDARTVHYTMELCQRVEGGLEVLHLNPICSNSADLHIKENFFRNILGRIYEKTMLERGIAYHPVWSQKCIMDVIADYVSSRRHIISVVIKSSDLPGRPGSPNKLRQKNVAALLQRIQCPVVSYDTFSVGST